MLLREEAVAGVEVLEVVGDVDDEATPVLQTAVRRAAANGPRGVLIDLSHTGALSPGAVDALCLLTRQAGGWPRPAVVVCCAAAELVPLLGELDHPHDDREAALSRVDERPAGGQVSTEVTATPQGPAEARRVATRAAREGGFADLADDVALVVSELVTNAVRYGSPPVRIEIDTTDDSVVVLVEDASPAKPSPRKADDDAEGGRGLLLVEMLARETGVRPSPPGKAVWAEVRRAVPPAS